ncbi:hypothetical protein OG302_41385 [Streptomyces sp. NBC_01283]|uniref:hypothetical protein n=1 Tax=Streptomyces sp. NBC_01283 TaxID=2903812 RepID=UPI00352F5BA7|nr:hypothetical protein OG302_41385 [Streptomyces sp. NBC_01283]
MIVLFAILVVALLGFGFLNPMWWAAAAVLIFGVVHYGRGGGSRDQGGNFEYRDYRDYRDRQNRWARRYRRRRQGRWNRQDRWDEQHHR